MRRTPGVYALVGTGTTSTCWYRYYINMLVPVLHQHVKPSFPTMGIFDIRTASVCKMSGILCPHWAFITLIYKVYAEFKMAARQSALKKSLLEEPV